LTFNNPNILQILFSITLWILTRFFLFLLLLHHCWNYWTKTIPI